MNSQEYYELPYGVADRMELQNFILADYHEGMAKAKARERTIEPQSTEEIIAEWLFQLKPNVEVTGSAL